MNPLNRIRKRVFGFGFWVLLKFLGSVEEEEEEECLTDIKGIETTDGGWREKQIGQTELFSSPPLKSRYRAKEK
ncbi:hypothetical protein VNO77_39478 [Canavalia gladiata]|uniref:Uncharacterized protein n=1 Tax=Canavalia gladiata TaxID=3824 RepID=A0AAN9KC77_CANGL